jgi:hypothetical protein
MTNVNSVEGNAWEAIDELCINILEKRLVPIWPVWYPKLNNDLNAEKGKLQASYCARCNIRSGFLQDLNFPKPHCSSLP